jgi:hypothetical protein
MNFEIGDVLFVRGNRWPISPIIKKFLGSEYSHVALAVGRDQIVEIDLFQKLKQKTNPHESYDVLRLHSGLTVLQKLQMQEYVKEEIRTNKGYDWGRIIEILLRRLTRWEGTIDTKNREICFEVIDLAYKSAGVDLKLNNLEELLLTHELIHVE